jgi:hypothetical protein
MIATGVIFMSIITPLFTTKLWADKGVVAYKGEGKCEGIQLEVSFNYDSEASAINLP